MHIKKYARNSHDLSHHPSRHMPSLDIDGQVVGPIHMRFDQYDSLTCRHKNINPRARVRSDSKQVSQPRGESWSYRDLAGRKVWRDRALDRNDDGILGIWVMGPDADIESLTHDNRDRPRRLEQSIACFSVCPHPYHLHCVWRNLRGKRNAAGRERGGEGDAEPEPRSRHKLGNMHRENAVDGSRLGNLQTRKAGNLLKSEGVKAVRHQPHHTWACQTYTNPS